MWINYRLRFPWGYRDVRIQFWVPNGRDRWIFVVPSTPLADPRRHESV